MNEKKKKEKKRKRKINMNEKGLGTWFLQVSGSFRWLLRESLPYRCKIEQRSLKLKKAGGR